MTSGKAPASIGDRLAGAQLRRQRRNAGYTGTQIATRAGWSPSTTSRMESGDRGLNEATVRTYLSHCGSPMSAANAVVELLHRCGTGFLLLRNDSVAWELVEGLAGTLHVVSPDVVPDLLQTEDYAHHLLERAPEAERALAELRARQRALHDPNRRLHYTVLLHESALRRPVGTATVMHEQLLHLALLRSRDNISIQVIPGHNEKPLSKNGFGVLDVDTAPVVHLRTATANLLIEHRADVRAYRDEWDRLCRLALDPHQSAELLMRLAGEYDRQPWTM
jgi:transcriptional regulator with XRE-family HTH domain